MGFNRYVLNIVIRSVLLAATALLMAFLAFKPDWFFTFVFIGILFILQVVLLTRYASKVNRYLSNFLIHLKEENTSLNLNSNTIDHLFGGLTNELKNINEEFKRIESSIKKEQNLLQLVLNQVGTGILLINNDENIRIANKAFLSIFDISNITRSVLQKEILPLFKNFENLKPGEQSIEILQINNLTRKILVSLTEIKEHKNYLRLYTFHDIDREITDYELQSWNGLIKVLSHEIMNTLTPMSTTTDTLKDCLTLDGNEKKLNELEVKDIQDAVKGIHLLENRISGLQNFIKKFRQFLDIPVPELKQVNLFKIIETIISSYKKQNITFQLKTDTNSLDILGDQDLLELVFINLIKNSTEAQANQININIKKTTKQVIVEMHDNGSGIDGSIAKKVFLPFYTTKEGGSGIGLSLARQVMFAHKGNIEVESVNNGTIVKLMFKNDICI